MLTYIEKKHYHVDKKVSSIGFVWHPDTLFQSHNISVGTYLPLVENIVKHIHFQDHFMDRKSMPSSNHIQFTYISSFLQI